MPRNDLSRSACFCMLVFALAAKFVMDFLPDAFVEPAFMRPAARLAALYWGAALSDAPLALSVRGVTLEVTRACAATDFFSLVFALFAFELPFRRAALRVLAALPAALAAAILANAVRLALLVAVDAALPAERLPAVHLAVGVSVFLSAYGLLWYGLLAWRGRTGRPSQSQ